MGLKSPAEVRAFLPIEKLELRKNISHVAIPPTITWSRSMKRGARCFQIRYFIELAQIPFVTRSYMATMSLKATKYFFSSTRKTNGMGFNYPWNTTVCER